MSGLQIVFLIFIIIIVSALVLGFIVISLPSGVIASFEKSFKKKLAGKQSHKPD